MLEGKRITVDFLWKAQRLAVETDGTATHANPIAFQRDRWRDHLLVAAGFRVSRVTWDQTKHEHRSVIARIARALLQPSQ